MTDFVVKKGLQIGGGTKLKSGTIAGNATLDLSSGNYFAHTPTADTTFVFSNPPAAGKAHGFALKVTGADLGVSYDIANASYDSVSFSVAAEEAGISGVFFKPDGTKAYIVGYNGQEINEYSLSTAWDISSATAASVFNVSAQEGSPRDLWFKNDGSKVYITGTASNSVHEYNLSTAWGVSSAVLSQSFSVSAQSSFTRGLTFKSDGLAMYVSDTNTHTVFQYNLSTAWNISTATYANKSYALTETNPTCPRFNADGTKLFTVHNTSDSLLQHSLSTAWDISTATYSNISFSVGGQDTFAQALFFKTDGSKMYIGGDTNNAIFQYTTGTGFDPATFTYPASVKFPNAVAPTAPAVGETDVLTFYTEDGGTTYYGFQAGDAMQ